ncbi:MAG: PQQ-binding-like beta-propeller repeat protein [Pirellulaceae bacterium]
MNRRAGKLVVVALVLLVNPVLVGQEWSRFRGPNGSGISPAADLPATWKPSDYHWKQPLPGRGHSSPVLWGTRLFLVSGEEATGQRFVTCLDGRSGKMLWQRVFAAETHRTHKLNNYAAATPVVDGQRLYVSWGTPEKVSVLALNHQGKTLWQRDLGPYPGGHGYGVSPIRTGKVLVLPNDQAGKSNLIALDSETGKTAWKIQRESKSAYATPCVRRSSDGTEELIFTNWEQGITAIDPETGKINWAADVFDKSHVESSIGSPVVAGNLVLGVCGWLGHGNEVVAVRPPAGHVSKATVAYRITRGAPLCTTPLVRDDLLFLWSDNGIVSCADSTTGEMYWTKRIGKMFYASPICIGKQIYNVDVDGTVVVLAASKEYQLLGRNDLGEASHSTPAVAGGGIYFRTLSQVFCLAGEGFARP